MAILCAAAYWAERRFESAASNKLAEGSELPEAELTPTLVQSRELPTVSTGPVSSNSKTSWDPQPQWRFDLGGTLKERSVRTSDFAPTQKNIPDEFPLPPRFKKGPPVIGNAVADAFSAHSEKPMVEPIRQPRTESTPTLPSTNLASPTSPNKSRKVISSTSVTTFSPFGSAPVSATSLPRLERPIENNISQNDPRGFAVQTNRDLQAWPDQNFNPTSVQTVDVTVPALGADPAAPNLLTNARISSPPTNPRQSQSGYSSAQPVLPPASGIKPLNTGSSSGSNYILQPMKSERF